MSHWEKVGRARKEHKCTFCNAPISAGQTYFSVRLTPWDHEVNDRFFTWKAHQLCRETWEECGHNWEWEWDEYNWPEFRAVMLQLYSRAIMPFPLEDDEVEACL